jgi:murein DD-endopeptidase MepM/ murein hydrolase activator NlpD
VIRTFAVATAAVTLLLGALTGASQVAVITSAGTAGFVKPVSGAAISQGFGCTSVTIEPIDHGCPGGHFHSGVDLAAGSGTPVVATAPGAAHVIVSAIGFGLHVIIDHGGGLQSLYGHLATVAVLDGDAVTAGEVIGAVGSSGNSTGPHLHFEFDRGGVPEDPQQLVRLP